MGTKPTNSEGARNDLEGRSPDAHIQKLECPLTRSTLASLRDHRDAFAKRVGKIRPHISGHSHTCQEVAFAAAELKGDMQALRDLSRMQANELVKELEDKSPFLVIGAWISQLEQPVSYEALDSLQAAVGGLSDALLDFIGSRAAAAFVRMGRVCDISERPDVAKAIAFAQLRPEVERFASTELVKLWSSVEEVRLQAFAGRARDFLKNAATLSESLDELGLPEARRSELDTRLQEIKDFLEVMRKGKKSRPSTSQLPTEVYPCVRPEWWEGMRDTLSALTTALSDVEFSSLPACHEVKSKHAKTVIERLSASHVPSLSPVALIVAKHFSAVESYNASKGDVERSEFFAGVVNETRAELCGCEKTSISKAVDELVLLGKTVGVDFVPSDVPDTYWDTSAIVRRAHDASELHNNVPPPSVLQSISREQWKQKPLQDVERALGAEGMAAVHSALERVVPDGDLRGEILRENPLLAIDYHTERAAFDGYIEALTVAAPTIAAALSQGREVTVSAIASFARLETWLASEVAIENFFAEKLRIEGILEKHGLSNPGDMLTVLRRGTFQNGRHEAVSYSFFDKKARNGLSRSQSGRVAGMREELTRKGFLEEGKGSSVKPPLHPSKDVEAVWDWIRKNPVSADPVR